MNNAYYDLQSQIAMDEPMAPVRVATRCQRDRWLGVRGVPPPPRERQSSEDAAGGPAGIRLERVSHQIPIAGTFPPRWHPACRDGSRLRRGKCGSITAPDSGLTWPACRMLCNSMELPSGELSASLWSNYYHLVRCFALHDLHLPALRSTATSDRSWDRLPLRGLPSWGATLRYPPL